MIVMGDNGSFISDRMLLILSKNFPDIIDNYKNDPEWTYCSTYRGYYKNNSNKKIEGR